jgi:hypothetical protein
MPHGQRGNRDELPALASTCSSDAHQKILTRSERSPRAIRSRPSLFQRRTTRPGNRNRRAACSMSRSRARTAATACTVRTSCGNEWRNRAGQQIDCSICAISIEDGRSRVRFASRWSFRFCSSSASSCFVHQEAQFLIRRCRVCSSLTARRRWRGRSGAALGATPRSSAAKSARPGTSWSGCPSRRIPRSAVHCAKPGSLMMLLRPND